MYRRVKRPLYSQLVFRALRNRSFRRYVSELRFSGRCVDFSDIPVYELSARRRAQCSDLICGVCVCTEYRRIGSVRVRSFIICIKSVP